MDFTNKADIPFKIHTNINEEPFLIQNRNFKLKITVKAPNLHQLVVIKATDLEDRDTVLLSGLKEISLIPKSNCDDDSDYLKVTVTSKPGECLKYFTCLKDTYDKSLRAIKKGLDF